MKITDELMSQFKSWYYCRPTSMGNVVCYGPYEEKDESLQHYIPGDAPGDYHVCKFRNNSSRDAELLKQSKNWYGDQLNHDPKVEVITLAKKSQ